MEKTETAKSSTLEKTEVPKHKNALAEKYEKENKEQHQKEVDGYERLKTKETSKLPRPTGWRLLVLPFKMPEKTKGGLCLDKILWKDNKLHLHADSFLKWDHIVMIKKNFLKALGQKRRLGYLCSLCGFKITYRWWGS
jgi:hypothetical protein